MPFPVAAVAERLDAFTARSLSPSGDPGAALAVASARGIVTCRGFGVDAWGKRITCDTRFAIASLTKSITAVAVMQLVERHRIALDAPVTAYLPWFATADDKGAQIKVRDALLQRTGFDTESGLRFVGASKSDDISVERRVRYLSGFRLHAVPGTHFEYSNGNYDILGALVEAVAHEPYLTYVNRRVLAPLGIAPAVIACDDPALRGFSRWLSVPVRSPHFPELCADLPAGGLAMSARQYGRFLAANIDAGRSWSRAALSRNTWEAIHHSPEGSPYAMGWFESIRSDGTRELRHDGWAPDFRSFTAFFPDLGIGAVRLADANEVPDGGRATVAEAGLEQILRGKTAPAFPWIPPDLYLRAAMLLALGVSCAGSRISRGKRAYLDAALRLSICAAMLWFVLPQWGYSVATGFVSSPDLTLLVLALATTLVLSALWAARRAHAR